MFNRNPEKISMVLLVMILVFSACSILYISVVTTSALKEQARDDIRGFAMFAAGQIDGDSIAMLRPGDEQSVGFLAAQDTLRRIKESHSGIEHVSIVRQEGSRISFVIDGDYGISTDAAPIGWQYIGAGTALQEGFLRPAADNEVTSGGRASVLTGYSPIRNAKGEVVGLVAVEMGKDAVTSRQDLITWTSFMIVFLAILMAVFGVLGVEQVRSRFMKDLKDRETRYHALFEETCDAIFIMVEGRFTDCNSRAGILLHGTKDQIRGKDPVALAPVIQPDGAKSAEMYWEKYHHALAGEHQRFEWRQETLDGREFDAEVSLIRIQIDGPVAVQAIIRDITETKKAGEALRQSEEKYRILAEASPNAISIINRDATIAYANTYALAMLRKELADVKGKSFMEVFPMESAEIQIQIIVGVFQHGNDIRRDDRVIGIDGKEQWLSSIFTPLKDTGGSVTAVLCVSYDITERKAMETQIAASLREKEYLLKEIHHRVKNNLQVISSLLSMQADKALDKNVIDSLTDSQNRVRSIALVHEKLYQSKSLDRIEYADYLTKIVSHLFDTYRISPSQISCRVHAENILIDITQAVPCSLIINEMLTNTLKYAFPQGRKGEISIDLTTDGKNYVLTYQDNGTGIPEGVSFERSESLGMKLIWGLTQQLNGTVILKREGGTMFVVTFPCIQKNG